MAFFFVLFVLSSIGLPGLNGFVSEFTTLFAAFNSWRLGPWFGVLGASGILLGAIYMLYATGKVLFGPVREPEGTPDQSTGLSRDLNAREILILAPLAFLVIALGVYPRAITDTLDPALEDQVMAAVRPSGISEYPQPADALAALPSETLVFDTAAAPAPADTLAGGGH